MDTGLYCPHLENLIQIGINSLVSGMLLSLVAIGFTYIFQVTRVFHLAHGALYLTAAVAYWWLDNWLHSRLAALSLSLAFCLMLIYLIEKLVYLPLNKRASNQSITLIVSMALYIIIVNFLSMFFGNQVKVFNVQPGAFSFGGIIITYLQVVQSGIALLAITVFAGYIHLAKIQLPMQAVSASETNSQVIGINTERVRLVALLLGTALAAIGAILKTAETGVDLRLGLNVTLTASVVAILVARVDWRQVVVFSIILSILQNAIEWFISAQWRDGITFLLLLAVILLRTEGIIKYNLRRDLR